jgi:hypothetical protein
MGQGFSNLFAERPDTFYRELTLDQILFLRNATNMTAVQQAQTAGIEMISKTATHDKDADSDEEGQRDSSEHGGEVDAEQQAVAQKVKAIQEKEEREEQLAIISSQRKEESMVKTMHAPFDILGQGSIYAGSKYNQETKISDLKFSSELDKLKYASIRTYFLGARKR